MGVCCENAVWAKAQPASVAPPAGSAGLQTGTRCAVAQRTAPRRAARWCSALGSSLQTATRHLRAFGPLCRSEERRSQPFPPFSCPAGCAGGPGMGVCCENAVWAKAQPASVAPPAGSAGLQTGTRCAVAQRTAPRRAARWCSALGSSLQTATRHLRAFGPLCRSEERRSQPFPPFSCPAGCAGGPGMGICCENAVWAKAQPASVAPPAGSAGLQTGTRCAVAQRTAPRRAARWCSALGSSLQTATRHLRAFGPLCRSEERRSQPFPPFSCPAGCAGGPGMGICCENAVWAKAQPASVAPPAGSAGLQTGMRGSAAHGATASGAVVLCSRFIIADSDTTSAGLRPAVPL